MNNEENKNQDLTYDFDFENQVVKNEQEQNAKVEVLNDTEFEELEEVDEVNDEPKIEELQEEILEENTQTTDSESKTDDTNNKKIKILGKEFMFEDAILVIIGVVIIASIFLLPKIMKLFN